MNALGRACLPILVAAALALPALAQEIPRDLTWGVNGHPLVSYPGVTIDQQLDYVRELGMTSYRVDVARVEHAPGLAALVRAGKARGIDILPVLAPDVSLKKETAEDLYRKAHDFAVNMVSRFKDDIRVWELGNELENYAIIRACEMRDDGSQYDCAWGPAGGVGPLEYYGPRWAKVSAVLKGLSDGTTAVDPMIRKAIGTAGWGHTGAFGRMRNDGIRWDISVWHMYGQDPEWAFKILADFNRPIWVTEFNNPGGSKGGAEKQADGIVRAMTHSANCGRRTTSRPHISTSSWTRPIGPPAPRPSWALLPSPRTARVGNPVNASRRSPRQSSSLRRTMHGLIAAASVISTPTIG